jgi:N-acetylglucosaminyldiphosphoundecaprenol N-acetyl-beta-D-mannosaminyltransferase
MTDAEVHAPLRRLFGVGVHAVTMDQALGICRRAVQTRRHLNIGVVNAAKIVAMRRSPLLFDAVAGADLVLADGMAVVWAAKILRQPLPGRVTGIDLFERLLRLANECRYGIYFLGATQQVLDEVLRRVGRDHPHLRIAGSRNGYFSEDQAAGVAEDIRRSRADMLFVAMTSPKKELFLGRFGRRLDVAVCHGVGGSFDVLAGKVSRAPHAWQALGLEWLYRVLQEPRRMWKRYLVTNVQFASLLLHEALASRPIRPERTDAALPRPLEPVRRSPPFAGGGLPDAPREAGPWQLAQLTESDGRWHVRLLPGLVDCMSRFRANGKGQLRSDERGPDPQTEVADLTAAK